jgi:hypothetical protein
VGASSSIALSGIGIGTAFGVAILSSGFDEGVGAVFMTKGGFGPVAVWVFAEGTSDWICISWLGSVVNS